MAYLSPGAELPALDAPLNESLFFRPSIIARVVQFFRKRWIYYTTLSALEDYSERSLRDLGIEHGAAEFARRAARL